MKEFINGKSNIDLDYIEMLLSEFNKSISENSETIFLGYEVIDDEELKEYTLPRKEWTKTLKILLKSAIKLEEYEICDQITKLISQIEYNN